MVKNGGRTPTSSSTKCKEFCKQVTGQHIVHMLDCQLGPMWREDLSERYNKSEDGPSEKAQPLTPLSLSVNEPATWRQLSPTSLTGGGESVLIIVSKSRWSKVIRRVTSLATECNKLRAGHERVCAKLAETSKKLRTIGHQCAKNKAIIDEMSKSKLENTNEHRTAIKPGEST